MKVKELIEFLQKYPENTTVLAEGFNYDGTGRAVGELNVTKDFKGLPMLSHYQIGISFDGGVTWEVKNKRIKRK